MQEFDFHINPPRPTLGLYVPKDAGLPDLALTDARQWRLESHVWANELQPETLMGIELNGHTFQELSV
jgi:hypothetical protein